ncbi:MAG: hypothetical protein ACR2OB_01375 [Solirubrobacteraceae bacterium]
MSADSTVKVAATPAATACSPPEIRRTTPGPQTTLSFAGAKIIPSANVGTGENDFYGLDASPAAAWAVGRSTDRATDLTSPLAETPKNGAWSALATPSPGGPGGKPASAAFR